jgi:RNA polymerase sigma-70 factor (ECF subfamily)
MSGRPEARSQAFPSTQWSRILAHEEPRDLEALARAYWGPIRKYLGARFRLADEAAGDLAQEAFAWMLETRFFDRADPARGRFRGLLKKALWRFANEHLRKQNAEKRGGGRVHEAIDGEHDHADPRARAPEPALDDAWRRELLERARTLLEAELEAGGRGTYYLLFRDYFLDEGDGEPGHAALAARHGITKADVSNWLDYAKRRYRGQLHALVLETVSDEEGLREELRWLFGPLAAKGGPAGKGA